MAIVGIRESSKVIGWAVIRVNHDRVVKHDYVIKQVPNRPYVAVSASQAALEDLYVSLQQGGCDDFKVGELLPHEVISAGF